jgi:hypothetical protein
MKNLLLSCIFILSVVFADALGGIALGDSYDSVIIKYPFPQQSTELERVQMPYPLNLQGTRGAYVAQAKRRNIECFMNDEQKVIAVSAFLSDDTDLLLYETNKGLRLLDSLVELKLLYGTPVDMSEYTYKDLAFKEPVTRRIYYYQNLCVQTRQYGNVPEVIDSLLIGEYNPEQILAKKDLRINPKKNE